MRNSASFVISLLPSQAKWGKYVQWNFGILRDLNALHSWWLPVQEVQHANGDPVDGPKLRNLLFSLAPVARLGAHYIHLDTMCLWVRHSSRLAIPI